MIKRPNLRRPTVELSTAARPSRIRREPPPPEPKKKALQPYAAEREVWTVVIGVVLFALAITVATVGISNNVFN
jgi:hypothetical protein